ncbi:hypothetical protein [Amycolatopsis sp. cmx-11-51]|uniref:hypothetical protein n=1 Tax=unclassified Amycolatopsis TaxID=2618356 RepID=UPI0039E3BDCF
MKKILGRIAILTASAAILFGGATGTAAAVDWVFIGSYPTEGQCLVAADAWASSDVRTRCQYTQMDGWHLYAYTIGG